MRPLRQSTSRTTQGSTIHNALVDDYIYFSNEKSGGRGFKSLPWHFKGV